MAEIISATWLEAENKYFVFFSPILKCEILKVSYFNRTLVEKQSRSGYCIILYLTRDISNLSMAETCCNMYYLSNFQKYCSQRCEEICHAEHF